MLINRTADKNRDAHGFEEAASDVRRTGIGVEGSIVFLVFRRDAVPARLPENVAD